MAYPNIDMLYLSEKDMIEAGVTDVLACTDCMVDVVKALDEGDYRMGGENGNSHGCQILFPDEPAFPNMPKNGPDRRFMAMPAYIGGKFDMAGVKWYGSNVDNREKGLPRSILMVILNDKDTGAPIAYMSANLISSYRTAAIPGVGVKLLSKEDSKVIAAIGPGAIQATQVETFAALRPSVDTLKIKGRGRASIDRFIAHVKETCPNIKNAARMQILSRLPFPPRPAATPIIRSSSANGLSPAVSSLPSAPLTFRTSWFPTRIRFSSWTTRSCTKHGQTNTHIRPLIRCSCSAISSPTWRMTASWIGIPWSTSVPSPAARFRAEPQTIRLSCTPSAACR